LKLPSLSRLPGRSLPARFSLLSGPARFLAGALAVLAAVAVVSAIVLLGPGHQQKHLTAYFPEATGLYTGDRVQVLGVPVGQVTSITPQAGRVKVEMTYDPSVKIPAGAKAAIVTPTLVTTRTIQLTPAYHSGAVLADGAAIPESSTAVPVEWDQVEQELNTLATTLGPKGANSGALNKVLNVAAANLSGNGQSMHNTLAALSQAAQTLSDNRGDLFGTLDNLQKFIAVLQQANGQVGDFEQQLSAVSGVLAGNKQEVAAALAALHSSLGTVTTFVASNRDSLASNVSTLNSVTANLAASDQTLANILQFAPTQLANFNNIYDPINHAITGALASSPLQNPAEFICSTIFDLGGTGAECQQALGPLVNVLKTDNIPVSVDPVNRGGYGNQAVPVGPGASTPSSGSGGGGLLNLLLGGGGS
jgi:phospholipid/cholesterol/gamma-HCH transport system substrate-binding protein